MHAGIRLVLLLLAFCCCSQLAAEKAAAWPVGMSFVALTENGWLLYVVKPDSGAPQPVALTSEPRTPAYSPSLGLVAYVSAEGNVLQYDLAAANSMVVLEKAANVAYTQPVYSPERNSLLVVELQQARSKQTRIIEVDLQTGRTRVLSHQRSAQFEPVISGQNLYYTNVHCIENCAGRYIHEIWTKNLSSDDAHQLTLLNTLTQQPAISPDGKLLYVSSEKRNGKLIWKCRLARSLPLPCKAITSQGVADTAPAVAANGDLYFLRLLEDGQKAIVKTVDDSRPQTLPLPAQVTDIRDMEIGK